KVGIASPEVDADEARVRVLRGERVDGVSHPALLADLLEEARRGGAAEDRVEERGGETAPVRPGDPRRTDAHVVLLGLLALKAEARRRCLDERPPHVRAPGRRLLAPLRLVEQA